MNSIYKQAAEIQKFLKQQRIPFAFIGGFANALLGKPRITFDTDIMLLVPENEIPAVIRKLQRHFRLLPSDPVAFVNKTHVLPAVTLDGLRTDFIFTGLDYEQEIVNRAVEVTITKQRSLRICTPEDLIIMKLISPREKDRLDVPGIIMRQISRLDLRYIRKWLKHFERALDRSDLVQTFNQVLRKSK